MVKDEVKEQGLMRRGAIPEEFDLLRIVQLVVIGYSKPV